MVRLWLAKAGVSLGLEDNLELNIDEFAVLAGFRPEQPPSWGHWPTPAQTPRCPGATARIVSPYISRRPSTTSIRRRSLNLPAAGA